MLNNVIKQRTEEYSSLIARLYPRDTNDLAVLNVTFQVTDACNLRCSYCYQINKGNHVMPIEVAKKFIDMLLDNDENTQQYVDTKGKTGVVIEFIGGEPFLEVDLMDEIMTYFIKQMILKDHPWQYHYVISIASNGTLYFNEKVQRFIEKYRNHLSLSISIDGNKELHDACRVFPDGSGSYDIAIKAVHHYIDHWKGQMGSKMTLSPQNIQYTFEAVKSLIEE